MKPVAGLFAAACLLLAACGDGGEVDAAKTTGACPAMVVAYLDEHPGQQLILAEEADLNADGRADAVIIYAAPEGNFMRVLLARDQGYVATNEHKAPVDYQSVRFRDIDDKPPLEFIVQGAKGAKTGFAIYRVSGETVEDLFGEGMDDCC